MTDIPLSRDERRRLRWCRAAAYATPVVAALVTLSIFIAWAVYAPRAAIFGFRRGDPVMQLLPVVNALLGAAIAAAVIVRFHPVESRRLRSAALGFLFALPVYLFALIVFAAIADQVLPRPR